MAKGIRYSKLFFTDYLLVVIKFNDLLGYNYYVSNIGIGESNIKIELVGERCAEGYVDYDTVNQTYYCFAELPRRVSFLEKNKIELSEMKIDFSIKEKFDTAYTIGAHYYVPSQDYGKTYFPERRDYEYYIATNKAGMDEYRIIDEGKSSNSNR